MKPNNMRCDYLNLAEMSDNFPKLHVTNYLQTQKAMIVGLEPCKKLLVWFQIDTRRMLTPMTTDIVSCW